MGRCGSIPDERRSSLRSPPGRGSALSVLTVPPSGRSRVRGGPPDSMPFGNLPLRLQTNDRVSALPPTALVERSSSPALHCTGSTARRGPLAGWLPVTCPRTHDPALTRYSPLRRRNSGDRPPRPKGWPGRVGPGLTEVLLLAGCDAVGLSLYLVHLFLPFMEVSKPSGRSPGGFALLSVHRRPGAASVERDRQPAVQVCLHLLAGLVQPVA